MELTTHHPAEMDAVAARLLAWAGPRRVFAFMGEIGAGKTTLIQALCRRLGVTDEVTSPTFALVNEYAGGPAAAIIYHLDLYRLRRLDEALDIGLEEYLYSGHYCFVEWPELVEPLLPADVVSVRLTPVGTNDRKILFL